MYMCGLGGDATERCSSWLMESRLRVVGKTSDSSRQRAIT
jgi:hypothetical protein